MIAVPSSSTTGPLTCSATKAVTSGRSPTCGPAFVFDGVDAWPAINQTFHQRATELEREDRDWKAASGTVGAHGQAPFGLRPNEAAKVLADTISQAGRFRYSDEAGIEWAVLANKDTRDFWQGVAVGCTESILPLLHARRTELLKQIIRHQESLNKPSRIKLAHVQSHLNRLGQMQRWLTRLDTAMAILGYIYVSLLCSGPTQQISASLFAEEQWGPDRLKWPDGWREMIFESASVLSSIEVQLVRFGKTGWHPQPLYRQPASLGVVWRDTEWLEVVLSRYFVEFIGEWLAPGKPAANYAARHGANMRTPPEGEPL